VVLIDRVNVDLANDLGNTLSRVTRIVATSLGGRVPHAPLEDGLAPTARSAWAEWADCLEDNQPQGALRAAWTLLDATNKFLVHEEPWKLAKDESGRERLEQVLHEAAEALRHVALQVAPAIPDTTARIFRTLGLGEPPAVLPFEPELPPWGFPSGGGEVVHGEPLFPRIDKKAFFAGQAGSG
jgi:methionyl-tRNA synthetase